MYAQFVRRERLVGLEQVVVSDVSLDTWLKGMSANLAREGGTQPSEIWFAQTVEMGSIQLLVPLIVVLWGPGSK